MTKNKIPFLHTTALKILREEREILVADLSTVKNQIANLQYLRVNEPDDYNYFKWVTIYGGNVSKLTKLQNKWREGLKDVEASIKVLKLDGQAHHQALWEEQQYIEEVTSGPYNCLYGC